MAHTLLLADDNITTQRVVELTFAEHDVRVLSVSDGQQAIDLVAQQPPDILLVGVALQPPNGYDVAAWLQRQPHLQHIPLLLLAGAFDVVDDERVRSCAAAGVVYKPFEPAAVIRRVKELLGKSTDARAALVTEETSHEHGVFAATERSVADVDAGTPNISIASRATAPPHRSLDESVVSSPSPRTTASINLSDEAIERIATRVADVLSREWLGETVSKTVIDVSERLVSAEIARIRASATRNS